MSALNILEGCAEFSLLVPEVRVNLAYALPGTRTPDEVAAVPGRITVVRGLPRAAGLPSWGASDHLARRIIEVRRYAPDINAAINFRYDHEVSEVVQRYCSQSGLLFGWLDRTNEPEEVGKQDRSSMPWKVRELFAKYGAIPRISYEGPGWGKEPLFLVLGENAVEVATIAVQIARSYKR